MDDLIVIILTLIVAVVGTIGQVKKKKAATGTGTSPNNVPDFWEMLKEKEEDFYEPAEKGFTEKAETEKDKPVYSFTAQKEGKESKIIEEEKTVAEDLKEQLITKKFPLRKAVIFSEILNNKYT